jgi:hypothetical protein
VDRGTPASVGYVENETAWTFVRDEVSRYHALLTDAANAAGDQARATLQDDIAVLELIRNDIESAARPAERLSA